MQLDIWSDVACPWCYIGKRHIEAAIAEFDGDVEVAWHAFELDPNADHAPGASGDQLLMAKYGMNAEEVVASRERVTSAAAAAGLDYDLSAMQPSNTFDVHRLVRLATERGLGDAMVERAFRARFVEGRWLAGSDVLAELAADVGLDAGEARELLAGDAFATDVREDEALAERLGVRGVPFFVAEDRYGASGAQPPAALLQLLQSAAADATANSTPNATAGADIGAGDAMRG